jgi:hypothetical protein
VGVYVGLGRSTYAQRFSCVAVGELKIAALAGEVMKDSKPNPLPAISRTRNKQEAARKRPLEDFMVSN